MHPGLIQIEVLIYSTVLQCGMWGSLTTNDISLTIYNGDSPFGVQKLFSYLVFSNIFKSQYNSQ